MASKRIQAILSLRDDFSKALDKAKVSTENFSKEWDRVGRSIEKQGKKMKNFGSMLSSTVTTAVAGFATAGIAAYNEMDAGMDTVIAKTGATGKALEANKKVFNDLYRTSAFGSEQIGEAVGYMQSFTDTTGNQLENLSRTALQFSEITGSEVYESILMANRVMEQFGVGANQMPRIFDAMAGAAQSSGIEVGELFDVVQENIPQLKELGMGFEDAFSFAGRVGEAGYQMDRIFDSIKDSQSVLAESGYGLRDGLKMVQSQLESASNDTERLGIAVQYFGEENAAYMLDALEKGVVDLENFSNTSGSAAGTVAKSYQAMKGPMETLQTTWNNLKGTAGQFATAMIEGASPALETFSGLLQRAGNWVTGLDDGQKRMLATVALVVGGIGPLITMLGGLVTAFGSGFASVMSFVTILTRVVSTGGLVVSAVQAIVGILGGPLTLAITAAIAIGVSLYKNWDTVKARGMDAFKTVTNWVNNAKSAVSNLWQEVKNFVADSALGRLASKLGDVFSSGGSIGHNAKGTSFWRGGPTMVHERGGEIIDVPRGSRIYPHDRSVQMAYRDGQKSGGSLNVNFAGATFVVREEADVDRVARAIVKRLQLAERNRVTS